jgi:hypothetical protein
MKKAYRRIASLARSSHKPSAAEACEKSGLGQSGQSLVEFLFASITFFFALLGTLQLAFVLNAHSLVRYAAFNAARSAIVYGADRTKMQEAARLSLLAVFPTHGRADSVYGLTQNYLAAKKVAQENNWLGLKGKPITSVQIINTRGLKPGDVVPFDDPPAADKAVITVQVVHYYELVVPLVNAMVWRIWQRLDEANKKPLTLDELARDAAKARRRLSAKDREMDSGFRIPLVARYTMVMQSDLEGGK